MSEGGISQPGCPESGVRGCASGVPRCWIPCRHFRVRTECVSEARASSSRRRVRWRFEYAGPRMSRHTFPVGWEVPCAARRSKCRVVYAAAYFSCRMGASRTVRRPKCRAAYVLACATRRARPGATVFRRYLFGFACHGIQDVRAWARTMIEAPAHPITRRTS